jgi:MerR family transcriptional regulator, light-induced transcriptional regulator
VSEPSQRTFADTGGPVGGADTQRDRTPDPGSPDGDGDVALPEPLLGVAAAARRLGIAPATLRTWDRRYGLGPSAHTAGQHRRYSLLDLARLDVMRQALLRGMSVAEAAQHARSAPLPATDPGRVPAAPVDDPPVPERSEVDVPVRAGGGVLRLGGAGPAARGLGRAATTLDAEATRGLLDDAITARGAVAAWDEVARPVLVAVAERWEYTGAGVEIEHLLSGCVLAAFGARVTGSAGTGRKPVLLAGMPGEQHVLPTVALAAALSEHGVGCLLLGADLPLPALQAAVRRTAPAAVVLWSQLARSADVEVLRALPRTRPRFRTYVGGPGWSEVALPAPVVGLESLGSACSEISGAVTA